MESTASNNLLDALFESSAAGVLVVDHQGKIVLVNQSCARGFGYSEAELKGQAVEILITQKERKTSTRSFSTFFEASHSWLEFGECGLQGKHKSGKEFPVKVSLSSAEVDNRLYTMILIRDISRQEQATDENMLLSKIFHESLNDIYIINAQSFYFIKANAGALNKIGYSLEELQQLTPWDLKPDHNQFIFLQRVAPLLSGKEKKIIFESVFKRKDHSTFPVEIHLQLFEHESRQVFMETVIDITEKKKAERDFMKAMIEGQEAERDRIAKELHDELGQALTAMQLNLHTLEFLIDNSEKKVVDIFDKLKVILHNTIQETKSISRDLMPSVLRDYGLVKALEYLCGNFNDTLHLQVHLQVQNMEKKLDASRRVALYRIAQELINNACKNGKAKEVNVQLIRNEKNVVLKVEDDGKGFDPAAFNENCGRGLKNIESRVIALDGVFKIDSNPGDGTSASVEIPLKNNHEHN